MSTEYILSFTAADIDEKLSKIDELKNTIEKKQDVLTSSDFIEIKDGVIRSTLGDDTGDTVDVFNECATMYIESMFDTGRSPAWFTLEEGGPTFSECPIRDGVTYNIHLTSLKESTHSYYESKCISVNYDSYLYYIIPCNVEIVDEEFEKPRSYNIIDERFPAFCIIFYCDWIYGDIYKTILYSFNNLSNSSISIGESTVLSKYKGLPNNVLRAGNLIEIKDGVVRSTLGDYTIAEKDVTLINIEDFDTGESIETSSGTIYTAVDYTATMIPDEKFYCKAELLFRDLSEPIIYNNLYTYYDDKTMTYIMTANDTVTRYSYDSIKQSGFAKENENIPAFMIVWYVYSPEEARCDLIFSEEYFGASIKISQHQIKPRYVKLPSSALNIDKNILSYSDDRIPSSKAVIDHIDYAIEEGLEDCFEIDSEPREWSSNLITSGAVYNAMKLTNTEGVGTIAYSPEQHVQGRYNVVDTNGEYAHIVGNGTGVDSRSNAHTVDWAGNAWYAGQVSASGINLPLVIDFSDLELSDWVNIGNFIPNSSPYPNFVNDPLQPGRYYKVSINSNTSYHRLKNSDDFYYLGNLSLLDSTAFDSGEDFLITQEFNSNDIVLYINQDLQNILNQGSTVGMALSQTTVTPTKTDLSSYISILESRITVLEARIKTLEDARSTNE